jgi:hypothetical protein
MADEKSDVYAKAVKDRDEAHAEAKRIASIVTEARELLSLDPSEWRFDPPPARDPPRAGEMRVDDDRDWKFIDQSTWPTIEMLRSISARCAAADQAVTAAWNAHSPETKKIVTPPPSGRSRSATGPRSRRDR